MMFLRLRTLAVAFSAVLLSACFGPQTPQEVTQAFWEAAIEGDAQGAAEYSTLSRAAHYDGFDRDWQGYRPSWGKVVIDGDQARIESDFSAPSSDKGQRSFTTYLVRQDGEWLVDYERTETSVKGGLFGDLFSTMSRLGEDFTSRFSDSADQASAELETLIKELDSARQELSRQAEGTMDEFADKLRQLLREMDEAIQRTLEEEEHQLSENDKQLLSSTADDLEQRLESSGEASFESLLQNSQALAAARQRLDDLDTQALSRQQKQWEQLAEELSDEVTAFVKEMSGN